MRFYHFYNINYMFYHKKLNYERYIQLEAIYYHSHY